MAEVHSHAHWVVPTTLIVSFAGGISLALGHHYFYSTLQGLGLDEARWPQNTNNSIGTAFTFLVRSALITSISAAYWQIFWRRLHRPLTLSTIDDLAAQLRDAYQLFNPKNLKASPTLCALALLAWLIPVAVVFPPAALKVVPRTVYQQELRAIQIPNYNNSKSFVPTWYLTPGPMKRNGMGTTPGPLYAAWGGPSSQLRRTMFGTAYQGQLPAFTALAPNSSYSIDFMGPSLQCGPVSNKTGNVKDLVRAGLCLNGSAACSGGINTYFVSWVANSSCTPDLYSSGYGKSNVVPFMNGSITGDLPDPSYLGSDISRPQALFIAYRDNMSTKGMTSGDVALMNCTLYNATYSVSLRFVDGVQSVNLDRLQTKNALAIHPLAINAISNPGWPDIFSTEQPETQSYLAFMQAIGELLVGSLYWDNIPKTDQTQVFETELAYTKELYPAYANYTGSTAPPKQLRPLKATLEELVQNMTLSLLTLPSVLAPQENLTSVSTSRTYNAYHYDMRRLWLAYGAAVAATLLAMIVGLSSLAKSGASYSNKFSTVVRVSRGQSLDVLIDGQDRLGQDPLPPSIAKARLSVVKPDLVEKTAFGESGHASEWRELQDIGSANMRAKVPHVETSLLRDGHGHD